MEDLHFQRRGAAAAALPGRVPGGGRAKPAACYDDVFGGPPRASLAPARPEDYREIFGAAATCSIPVLDLPPPPGDGYELRQCSALDYLDIFGGLGGGDFAASYQELFASKGSNEVGAPPLPSELGGAAPVAGASNSRGLKGMGSEEQEMPASGVIIEGPSGDQVRCLSNGVAYCLNDDYTSNHVASWSSKNDSVHGTIHKNQVHAVPGFAFVVKSTEFDNPHTQVDVDIYFDAHCGKVTSEQQHLRKTMLSTTSFSDVKYSVNDMKGDQRSTRLESSGSLSASACEENPSCSSKNQSTVPSSNGFSAKASNNQILHGNCMEKKTEGIGRNETVLTSTTTASSGNDLKVKSTAVDFSANEGHLSHSSNGHSASAGIKSSPDHLTDAVGVDAVNTSTAEANHFTKSMSGSPPFTTSSQSSEDRMAEQKKSNSMYNLSKDATVNEGVRSFPSSTHSISSLDQSGPDGTFVTVSDINLRTQPFQGPPPARPPPARPSGRNLRRTWTEHQKHDMRTEVGYKSHSFKHPVRDGSPPPFDVEVDASSAAAASLAAIKEAMELAQARLKSAKVSMERKKDNLQSRRKLGLNEDPRSINRYEDETVQQNQKIREEVLIQLACEKTDGQTNVSTAEKMVTTFSPSLLTGDFKGKERDHGSAEESLQAMHWQEPGLSNLSNKKEDKVGEWKVAGQFYEFIQSEKNLKKVPENSLKEDNEKRPNARIGIAGEEPIASELKTSGKLLAASKVMEWEGDKATNEKKTKDSQVAALESYMPGDCNRRQKETVNAHHQEKRPGEFQELQETEQETKWRTSKEAFICELSEKNLRVNNDASKCKSVHGCQGQEKIQRSSGESSGCEETEKEIKVTEKYLRSQGEEKDNLVWSKLSQLDDNKIEAKVTCVSHVSAKNIHLQTVGKNHECENLKMQTNGYDCFPEGQNIKAKEARLFFGQDKGWLSKLALRAFEWAENEDEVETPMEVHDWKSNDENFNVVQGTDGCSGEAKRLKEIQKFPIESEEFQLKVVEQQNTSCTAGIKDNFEDNVTVAQEYCKRKITENVKEVQVVDSNMGMKSAHDVCKAPQESSGNQVADWPVENGSRGHEMEDVNGDKLESEQTRYVEEKEREIRKLEEKERENVKFEERDKKRIELEEEKEREKNLEVAKKRERGKLKQEKERERKIEEEKVRERVRLEEERERERKKLEEEMERKKLEEERERIRLEEERERERKKLEEERERQKLEEKREKIRLEEERESERQELEEERERIRLEEERERKKLEEERERQKLEQERERIRLEEERERERKKLEEERERQKLEEERERMRLEEEREREKKKLEGEERERKKIEDERREKKRLEEERERKKFEEAEERRKLEEEERRKLEEEERERMRKKQEEEDRERCKLEEKERERRKQEEDRERRRLEEIERERRKLEEKVRERRRIEEEERERKLEEEKARERQKIEEDKLTEKRLDEEREKEWRKREEEKEWERKRIEEEREREKEREKDRQAVERATREAHERAFAEARERAERAAVERITAEARQRALAEARERAEKTSVEALEKSLAEKASREARLRSERAAVERATAEARERAVEKAIAGKAAQDARERAEKLTTTTREGVKQNANIHASFANEKFGGSEGESAIRCKARMERHQRTVERAAKALAEKNLRDIIAQREQVERNRLAETLDADVKRWSNGKEGNLRALLSTLQYILGPESGWQPIPLTDVVTAPAVKKAYRKATLYVHPDKLQQRGASIQQKYICEKVFDLLKEAWNKFNSEER